MKFLALLLALAVSGHGESVVESLRGEPEPVVVARTEDEDELRRTA
jgi:hypothetical protein